MKRMKRLIVVPHLKKMRVENLPVCHDPSDPPLTSEALAQAEKIPHILYGIYGQPDLILASTRLRARQTAAPSMKRFSGISAMLECLGQPDSGEEDPANSTRPDGLVMYGRPTSKREWMGWAQESLGHIKKTQVGQIWVFTHSTIAAAFKLIALEGMGADPGRIDDFDPGIKPCLAYELNGSGHLSLLSKPDIKF